MVAMLPSLGAGLSIRNGPSEVRASADHREPGLRPVVDRNSPAALEAFGSSNADRNVLFGLGGSLLPEVRVEFTQLSDMLGDLLDRDGEAQLDDDFGTDPFPLRASVDQRENRLAEIPVLFLLLCQVPCFARPLQRRDLIPLVRAAVPAFGDRAAAVLNGTSDDDEEAMHLIEQLYVQAIALDSKTVQALADIVLYVLTVRKGADDVCTRLTERFEELSRGEMPDEHSLMETMRELARDRVNLLKIRHRLPLDMRFHPRGNGGRFSDDDPVEVLSHILEGVSAGPSQIILDWLTHRHGAWFSVDEALQGDADALRIAMVSSNLPGRVASQFTSLTALVDRFHKHVMGGEGGESGELLGDDWLVNEPKQPSRMKQASPPDRERAAHVRRFDAKAKSVRNTLSDLKPTDADDDGEHHAVTMPASAEPDPQTSSLGPSIVVIHALPTGQKHHRDDSFEPYRELVGKPLRLLPTPDLRPIRERLHHMLPHLGSVVDRILMSVSRHETVTLPPVLLVGDPGCGKTTLVEEMVRLLGVPNITVDAAGHADANLLGVDSRWGSGAGGVHLDLIREHEVANPSVIIDELEKVGGSARNGDLRQKLLGLLEPRRSQAFFDPFLGVPINLSSFSWMFTANSIDGIPAALLNRMEVLACPDPGPEHLDLLAPQLLVAEYAARGLDAAWATPLDGTEIGELRAHWQGGSIRDLRRLTGAVVDCRNAFIANA
ncbi:AAA family ATPase [Rhizobiaceae bacterium]|nr:AAA family ATPase [Rhizobiaceae bacterium]